MNAPLERTSAILDYESGSQATTEPRRSFPLARRIAVAALLLLLFAANLPFIYSTMFSSFATYDDEGYLLLTTRSFVNDGGVYTKIISPYGPFYFLYEYFSYAAGALPVTHDLNRLFTIGEWSAAILLISWIVFEVTASAAFAAVTCVFAIPAVTALGNEPGHPQGILLVLTAFALLLAVREIRPERRRWPWPLLGAVLAAIALTKVNCGVYVALAFALVLLPLWRDDRWRRIGLFVSGAAACVLPAVLMRAHLATWSAPYCIATTAAIAAILAATPPQPPRERLRSEQLKWLLIGAALLSASTLTFIALRGTSPGDLVTGWVVVPFRLSRAFQVPAQIGFDAIPAAVLGFVLAFSYRFLSPPQRKGAGRLFLILKILFGVYVTPIGPFALASYDSRLAYLGPFLWLVVVPPSHRTWTAEELFARRLLCLVAALQMLIAYPIAGSQLQMSTFLVLPVALVCVADAIAELLEQQTFGLFLSRPHRRLVATGWLVLISLLAFMSIARSRSAVALYEESTPLNLPGAKRIRLDHERAAEYQWVVANLRAHADRFVSFPGLNSFYLWSGIEPLEKFDATTWVKLFTDAQQRVIASRLLASPRACAVVSNFRYDRYWIGGKDWVGGKDVLRNPLMLALSREFVSSGLSTGSFEILERRHPWRGPLDNYLLSGTHEFRSAGDRMAAPSQFFAGRSVFTIGILFRTTSSGILLSLQDRTASTPRCYRPLMYVGNDGYLYAGALADHASPLRSRQAVADGNWHHAFLAVDARREILRLDGVTEVTQEEPPAQCVAARHCIIGSGYALAFPSTNDGWFPFRGSIASVIFYPIALTDEQMAARLATGSPQSFPFRRATRSSSTLSATETRHFPPLPTL